MANEYSYRTPRAAGKERKGKKILKSHTTVRQSNATNAKGNLAFHEPSNWKTAAKLGQSNFISYSEQCHIN